MMRYGVILADPPWAYRSSSDSANGAVSSQYSTMEPDALQAIPVGDWAADDCALFMWATWPKLDEAIPLIQSWGFRYVTGMPWVKTVPSAMTIRTGIGFWFQSATEMVLVGTRGSVSRQGQARMIGLLTGEPRQFYSPIGRHSAKPEGLQDWIEAEFAGPYLELFARRERAGWDCWGYDTGFVLSGDGVAKVPRPAKAQPLLLTL
jgi:N6-adenosine-specific RNA methylase IME4